MEAGPLKAVNDWLSARRRFVVFLVLFSASVIRVVYLVQIWNSPCAWMHRWAETDMYFFDEWAAQIEGGDLLTEKPAHPYPGWSADTAEEYFRLYPDRKQEYASRAAAKGGGRTPAQELWDEWYCAPCLHQGPMYPYLLALTYGTAGRDPRIVFIWQSLLGIASVMLLYFVALNVFNDLTAVIAGGAAVLYGPLLFYDAVLLRATLIVFASLLVLFLLVRSGEERRPAFYMLTGLGYGFALLVKKIFFPVTFIQAGFLLFRKGRPSLKTMYSVLFFFAGVFLCLLPVIVRNAVVGAPLMSLSSVNAFASTFINSNAVDSVPGYGYGISRHFARIAEETGNSSIGAVIETLKTHPSFSSVVSLFWSKWSALWHWYEQPNNVNFYYYRLHAPVLAYLPLTFVLVAPLGVVGMLTAFRKFRKAWPLYLMAAMYLGILMLGLVLSRYRVALAALLIPFAAFCVADVAAMFCSGRWKAGGCRVLVVAALSLWTMRPLPEGRPLIRSSYYSSVYSAYYSPLALQAIEEGNWRGVAELMTSSLMYRPEEVTRIDSSSGVCDSHEQRLADLYARVHERISEAWARAGEGERAELHKRRSDELKAAAAMFEKPSADSAEQSTSSEGP